MFCNSAQPLWEMPRQLKTAAAKSGLQECWTGGEPVLVEVLLPSCGEGHTLSSSLSRTNDTADRSHRTPASAMRLEMQLEVRGSQGRFRKRKSINTVAASHLGNVKNTDY